MCGISGIFYADQDRPVQIHELKNMTTSMIHRGPDDEGFFQDRNVGFGFRRLSIIDLSTGHQPLANEDDSVWIVFNGEVYNFPELRERMMAKGHQFKTGTDTETIVHLYEEYGPDCVNHLRGMFAFVIWDKRKRKMFCARDRFGIKPFFFHLSGERFVFGSEIKTVLAAGGFDRQVNLQALDSYFTYKYITGEHTIFQEVQKLLPGHRMELTLKDGRWDVKEDAYWQIQFAPDYSLSEQDWCEQIEAELSAAVKMRMIADVPLGAFLSGGVDSSSVVALMAQNSANPIKTFSIGFKEKAFNELPYAREVAKLYGTEHHEQIIEPESISLLPKLIQSYDEPYADSSAIPTYYVSKFAREYVTVVLSGDGGDELFAGYNSYPKLSKLHKYNRMPAAFNRHFWGGVNRMLPDTVKGKGLSYYLSLDRQTVGAHYALWQRPERQQLYKGALWDQVKGQLGEEYKLSLLRASNTKDYLSRMQELDMQTYMVDDILTKVDRASMLNSLEARVPILDHKVAELSFRIPPSMKLKQGQKKYILREAMRKHLPSSILDHKKQGFSVPLGAWFKDSLKEYMNDRLLSSNSNLSEYLNQDYIRQIVDAHQNGMRDLNGKIWSLVVMDAWLEQYKTAALV
ncbi:MAG: asparagine synthase (glutamine-hydrolyzing) [Bacteroidia bacterium]